MTRFPPVLVLVLAHWAYWAAATTAQSRRQPPVEAPSFTADSSELVVLPVTVTDRQGRFITGLPRERFSVLDDGRRQQIDLFTGENSRVSVAVVIDDSGSMRGRLGQVLAATIAFAKESHRDDEMFVFEFNDTVRDALQGGRVEAGNASELEAALNTLVPQGRTALYDGLVAGLERLEQASHARKVLVLMSDGGDNASTATLEDVLTRARRSNVTIYAIGVYEEGASDSNPGVLKTLATTTGGQRFFPRSPGPLLQACRKIAQEIRSGYTIGYVPPVRDGRYHTVRVQIDPADGQQLLVRTRPGYFAANAAAR